MRVLHINCNYVTSALHQTMIEHLNRFGIYSRVFVPTYDEKRSVVEPKDYADIVRCFKKWDRLLYHYKQRKIGKSIQEKYDINSFDCIHAYTLFSDGNIAMQLSKKYNKPYIVTVRNTDLNYFLKYVFYLRPLGIEILKNASAIIFLSPAYKNRVLEKFVPEKYKRDILRKSYIIPNGIDDFWLESLYKRNLDALVKFPFNQKELNCIYVGGIDYNKNIELTLKALNKFYQKGWKCTLTVVGKIVDKKVFNRLTKYSFFVYVEPKIKEDLISFYRKADMFVMPSHKESFGLVYAEAMSQGLPVIYTKGQGFDGQFADGIVGFGVSDKSIEDLISKIKMIIKNYKKLSLNASINALKFDWNDICKCYLDIYKKIILQ